MSYYREIHDQDFQPLDSDAHGWVQWKGTDVCIDLHCKCGHDGHIDGEFFYYYKCPVCRRRYAVGSNVRLIELTDAQAEEPETYGRFMSDD